jgi:phosphatidate cytidylyltransferase
MLAQRMLTVIIGGPLVIAVAVIGEPWLSLMIGAAVIVGLFELSALLVGANLIRRRWVVIAGGTSMAVALLAVLAPLPVLAAELSPALVGAIVAGLLMALGLAALDADEPRQAMIEWGSSLFGSLYIGLLLPTIAVLGHLSLADGDSLTALGPWTISSGTAWLFLLLAIVWSFDSAAYLGGRAFGRRKLAPRVSPGKTIEGVVAGAMAAAIAGALAGAAWLDLAPWLGLVLGATVGLIGQAGDLMESLIKRAAGAKDSGALFPGHGGLLDRVDSLLFSAPLIVAGALLAGAVILPG